MSSQHLENLINDFSLEHLERFMRDRSAKFTPRKEALAGYDDELCKSGVKTGEISFSEVEKLIVCAFECNNSLSERSGKKIQYDMAKKVLRDQSVGSGIFVFFDGEGNFRFSLIFANYKGTKLDWSTFKRFTYFVSKDLTNKTFRNQIGDVENNFVSINTTKELFSVEKVTNKFFTEFRAVFEKTKQELEKTNKNTVCLWLKSKYSEEEYKEQINKFAFTFLGRLIFVYFLLRKGWVEGQKDYLRKFVLDKNNSNLYRSFFEPLFFDVFATKEVDRKQEIKNKYKNTPYLNGGLFERSDLEDEMVKSGKFVLFDDDFIRSIVLDYFEAYNFTVDENSIDDQEVSIDPEMLGKVFENTLAEEERGKKGTFYTPREIVHYMVNEALEQYLINETAINKEMIHNFIFDDNFDLDQLGKENIRIIDNKLDLLKVLDPAVGSGAFPVEMMQVLVKLRKHLSVKVGTNINEVSLKKSFIKNNLYGVDIDPSAIEIAKLRLWLSLIVDYDKNDAEPLPNLDFQFRVGNSLQEKIGEIDIFNESGIGIQGLFKNLSEYEKVKDEMILIKDRFYISQREGEKHQLKNKFDELEHKLIYAVLEKYRDDFKTQLKNLRIGNTEKSIKETIANIDKLEAKIKDGTYKLFKPDFHFSEVFDRKNESGQKILGFDIVIGNPPYGILVDEEIKNGHDLGSKDSYGVFISTSLRRFLKPSGILSFIVSDTWLTIKTHKKLRQQVLEKQVKKIIRLHQDCFEATVNACILILVKNWESSSSILAADLTNISTRADSLLLQDKLNNLDAIIGERSEQCAVYQYKQDLIQNNLNKPIFIASPKIFSLMMDSIDPSNHSEKSITENNSYKAVINKKTINLDKLEKIAEVKVGMQTGDNHSYLFQKPHVRGTYQNIEDFLKFVLSEFDLTKIRTDDNIREKIIEFGFHKSTNEKGFDPDCWFGGKYIVPYEKGGESDSETGWLPNYYVPTNYFIDWSQSAVQRMKTLTIGQKNGSNSIQIASVFRNKDTYFYYGITFSDTGFYAPTFRLNSGAMYDVMGMTIFSSTNNYLLLGLLCSKLSKYLVKNYINHTVHTQAEGIKPLPMITKGNEQIILLVKQIIEKQKNDPFYDYANNEQIKIDKIVYNEYGLNNDDIEEVDYWYKRRYPKLSN